MSSVAYQAKKADIFCRTPCKIISRLDKLITTGISNSTLIFGGSIVAHPLITTGISSDLVYNATTLKVVIK